MEERQENGVQAMNLAGAPEGASGEGDSSRLRPSDGIPQMGGAPSPPPLSVEDIATVVSAASGVAAAQGGKLSLEDLAGQTVVALGAGGARWASVSAPYVGAVLAGAWGALPGAGSGPDGWTPHVLSLLAEGMNRLGEDAGAFLGAVQDSVDRAGGESAGETVPDDTSLVGVWLRLLFSGSAFDLHGDVRLKCNIAGCECLLYRHNAANKCAQCDHSFTDHTFGILSISRVLESISDLVSQHKDLFWGLMINQCTAFEGSIASLAQASAHPAPADPSSTATSTATSTSAQHGAPATAPLPPPPHPPSSLPSSSAASSTSSDPAQPQDLPIGSKRPRQDDDADVDPRPMKR